MWGRLAVTVVIYLQVIRLLTFVIAQVRGSIGLASRGLNWQLLIIVDIRRFLLILVGDVPIRGGSLYLIFVTTACPWSSSPSPTLSSGSPGTKIPVVQTTSSVLSRAPVLSSRSPGTRIRGVQTTSSGLSRAPMLSSRSPGMKISEV
jgi:hypothetical protein